MGKTASPDEDDFFVFLAAGDPWLIIQQEYFILAVDDGMRHRWGGFVKFSPRYVDSAVGFVLW